MPARCCTYLVILCALLTTARPAQAAFSYYVSDRTEGNVWALQDTNGDGDALDTGEKILWADSFASIVEMHRDGQSILALEEGLTDGMNQVVRLTDLNNDGDALDSGERVVWADGLDDPRGITRDADGYWYVTEIDDARVWRLNDLNADGDALDIGERTLYADNLIQATTIMPFAGGMLVTSFTESVIYHVADTNLDGDALDPGETSVVVQGISQPLGLLPDGEGGFYFSSRNTDAVYHAKDRNGDGDMLDAIEVLSYADSVFGGVNGSWEMTAYLPGGLLLADYFDGEILQVNDNNGDGDALDLGDVHVFADGFKRPVDIVAGCGLAGDLNCDGFVGIADLNIVLANWNGQVIPGVWHLGDPSGDGFIGIDDLNTVLGNWNAGTPPSQGSMVPEPASAGIFLLLAAGSFIPRRSSVG